MALNHFPFQANIFISWFNYERFDRQKVEKTLFVLWKCNENGGWMIEKYGRVAWPVVGIDCVKGVKKKLHDN